MNGYIYMHLMDIYINKNKGEAIWGRKREAYVATPS
jgi:hypothetical protein